MWYPTKRLMTSVNGYPVWPSTFLPFGQEWNPQITVNHYKFTGKERDSESGLDNFGARYDSSQFGRFMSPDPGNWGADPSNPQSWNAYSYVLNNPLNAIDPSGMNCVWDDGSYDADDDKQTGTQGGCAKQGGTWINQVTCDWNSHANADLAAQVKDIQDTPSSATVTGDPGTGFEVNKTYSGTFACSQSSSSVIRSVQSNFSSFANYSSSNGNGFAVFSPGSAQSGNQLLIDSQLPYGSKLASEITGMTSSVTVNSSGSNSFSFKTNPGHPFFPGNINFSAYDAGGGKVAFSVNVESNFANQLSKNAYKHAGGNQFEDSIWNNLISNVQGSCQ